MADSASNTRHATERVPDIEYLYATNTNVSNIVSVKLSSHRNYLLWKSQMLCLMKSHNMAGIVDDSYVSPSSSDQKIMDQYDSLLKGWIFGSASENVLGAVIDLASAKEVWDKLKSFYDVTISHQPATTDTVPETETETKTVNEITAQTNTDGDDAIVMTVNSMRAETEIQIVVQGVAEKEAAEKEAVEKEAAEKAQHKKKLGEADLNEDHSKPESIPKEDIHVTSAPTNTDEDNAIATTRTGTEIIEIPTETEAADAVAAENEATEIKTPRIKENDNKKKLWEATMKGDWFGAESIIKKDKNLVRDEISIDGTVLHIAVGIGHDDFVKKLISYITSEDVVVPRKSDGSTSLHIAAIVGNTYAAELLFKKNKHCLQKENTKGEEPLYKAYENMHLDTFIYLLNEIDKVGKHVSDLHSWDEIGVNFLVNAISAKEYKVALELINRFPEFASKNDKVLMAIAKTFPPGDHEETYIPSAWKDLRKRTYGNAKKYMTLEFSRTIFSDMWYGTLKKPVLQVIFTVISTVILIGLEIYLSIIGLLVILSLWMLYVLKRMGIILVEPIRHIMKKEKEMDEAETVLRKVCDEIDKLEFTGTHRPYYTRPILEAACQNAHKVVDEILNRSPQAIQSKDKSGYDIIQLAIIHRSEKVYNHIYDSGERKNLYRMIVDPSGNNILHLAGRLAPLHKLNHRAGAALQLQRELQWREEVKKFVFPANIAQENIFLETPDMVFTREHEKLLKEGEQWMKTAAESCSITAALITTIVFAAAITVPGGSNQDTGIPVFTKRSAFITFAVSDAISLFASSTALLVFLSILTARFSEKDFLVSLPRRLLIGICTLLLSAISLMVAFGASLFLVFCHQKKWMLAPICGLSLIPISVFVALQLPLIVDLYQSTYSHNFGPRRRAKVVNPDKMWLASLIPY